LSSISQGLSLSLAGILITFAYFGLLILVMVLLREIFKVPPGEKKPEKQKSTQEIDRMKAAGIAVTVAILKSKVGPDASLGRTLETPPGRWWRGARHRGS
jgi:Na+-transporting methylmalonyl-CoA/oxaloacetate decarboxylase gamma subunit